MDVGKRIKKLRKEKKLSQYKLAQITDISQSFISALEAGKRDITVNTLEKLCKGLGVSLDMFFQGQTSNLSKELIILLEEAKNLKPQQIIMLTKFLNTI